MFFCLIAIQVQANFKCDDGYKETAAVIKELNEKSGEKLPSGLEGATIRTASSHGLYYETVYTIQARDEKKRIVELEVSDKLSFGGQPKESKTYKLGYAKDGSCLYKQIVKNSRVLLYDERLCKGIAKIENKFPTELDKCNKVLSEMSDSIKNFEKMIKGENLAFVQSYPKSPFSDVLSRVSECAKYNESEEVSTAPLIRPSKKNETYR